MAEVVMNTCPVYPFPATDRAKNLVDCFAARYNSRPDFMVRVPGRVNLIGEHIDYCGYGVCPMALEQDILLAVSSNHGNALKLSNVNHHYEDYVGCVGNIEVLIRQQVQELAEKKLLVNKSIKGSREGAPKWYQYVLCGFRGVLDILPSTVTPRGLNILVSGTIPPSAGLSSSSALVSAAALATTYAYKFPISKEKLATLCAECERYIGTQGGGMDQAIAFLATQAAPQNANLPALDGRIVGGNAVDIEDFPYQLSLLYYGSHICGASLISSNFAVTAAHCTSGSSASQLSIRAGSSIRNSGGTVVSVKTIHQNPSYNPSTIDHDISVLELASALSFSDSIAVVGLPKQDQAIEAGATSVVSGWGTLTEGGSSPSQLQAVEVQVVSNADCADAYGSSSITDRMMCAGVPGGGKDACQGDSGGPLVIDGELIGIVSWGYGCARPSYPGVYSSVPALRSYITSSSGI